MAKKIKPKDTVLRHDPAGKCPAVRVPNGDNNFGVSRSRCVKFNGHKGKHRSDDGKEWR